MREEGERSLCGLFFRSRNSRDKKHEGEEPVKKWFLFGQEGKGYLRATETYFLANFRVSLPFPSFFCFSKEGEDEGEDEVGVVRTFAFSPPPPFRSEEDTGGVVPTASVGGDDGRSSTTFAKHVVVSWLRRVYCGKIGECPPWCLSPANIVLSRTKEGFFLSFCFAWTNIYLQGSDLRRKEEEEEAMNGNFGQKKIGEGIRQNIYPCLVPSILVSTVSHPRRRNEAP